MLRLISLHAHALPDTSRPVVGALLRDTYGQRYSITIPLDDVLWYETFQLRVLELTGLPFRCEEAEGLRGRQHWNCLIVRLIGAGDESEDVA
ncbi:MAG: hypothetical protein HY329_06930 [Chloroflexi bacterium]|nr:hypothetical protein [Chloroflexota bacterium]